MTTTNDNAPAVSAVVRDRMRGGAHTGTIIRREGRSVFVAWHHSTVEDQLDVDQVEIWADAPDELRQRRAGSGSSTPTGRPRSADSAQLSSAAKGGTMRRVAIYAREDPTADAQARLAAQIATATGFVRGRRGRHIATYADLSPATTLERPGLIHLTAHARAGCFDLVVVERRETVAPDPASRRQVRDQLAASGVTVVVIRPPLATRLGRVVAGLALVDLVEDR